jgi:hypothetical protein
MCHAGHGGPNARRLRQFGRVSPVHRQLQFHCIYQRQRFYTCVESLAARDGLIPGCADLDHQYGQHGLLDQHERLCQRAGQPTAGPTGGRRVGSRHRGHGRYRYLQRRRPRHLTGAPHPADAAAGARNGQATLQYLRHPGLLGLSGGPRHRHPQSCRERGKLALRCDGGVPAGQHQRHHVARLLLQPELSTWLLQRDLL